jgi:hypothetical protein
MHALEMFAKDVGVWGTLTTLYRTLHMLHFYAREKSMLIPWSKRAY